MIHDSSSRLRQALGREDTELAAVRHLRRDVYCDIDLDTSLPTLNFSQKEDLFKSR